MAHTDKLPFFPVKFSPAWAAKMVDGDLTDPLFLQVHPTEHEFVADSSPTFDPVGDLPSTRLPGILQKYHGRVLVNLWPECPIHCRFCFRRNLSYADFPALGRNLTPLVDLLERDPSITEVIFSGGDPFMADDDIIEQALARVIAVPTVRRIRFHTRVPIALPGRIHSDLLALFDNLPIPVTWVLHTNHPNEIDQPVQELFSVLRHHPIRLLSQSVLLNGINNQLETLSTLFEKLFDHGVFPYYLHLLDQTAGTHHFHVPFDEAYALISALQATLPGYLVPRMVKEIQGESSKTHVVPNYSEFLDQL